MPTPAQRRQAASAPLPSMTDAAAAGEHAACLAVGRDSGAAGMAGAAQGHSTAVPGSACDVPQAQVPASKAVQQQHLQQEHTARPAGSSPLPQPPTTPNNRPSPGSLAASSPVLSSSTPFRQGGSMAARPLTPTPPPKATATTGAALSSGELGQRMSSPHTPPATDRRHGLGGGAGGSGRFAPDGMLRAMSVPGSVPLPGVIDEGAPLADLQLEPARPGAYEEIVPDEVSTSMGARFMEELSKLRSRGMDAYEPPSLGVGSANRLYALRGSQEHGGFSVSRTPSQRLAAGTASTSGVRHSTSRASANRTAPGTCAPGAASPGPSQRRGPGPRSEGSLPMLAPEFRAQPPISPQPSPHRGLRVTDGDRPVSPQLSPRGLQGRGGPQGLALDPALLTVGSRTTRFRHLPTHILDADSDSDEEDGEEKRAEKGKGVEKGKVEPGGGKSGGDTAVQGEPSHGREAAASSSSSGDKQAAPPAAVVDAPLRTAFSSSGGGAAAAAAAGAGAGVAAASPLSPAALAALRCASVSSGWSTRSGSGRMGAASSRRSSLDAYLLNAASASASTGGRGSGRSGLSPGQELTASMLLDTYLCGHPLMARTSSSGLHDLLTGRSTDTTNSTNSKASLAAATAAGLFVSTARATVHSYGSRAPSLISFLESAAPPVAAPAASSTDPRLDPGTGAATAVAAEERGLPTRDGSAGGGSRDAAGAGRGRSAVNLPGTTFSFGHRKAAELQQGPGAAPGSPLALYPGVAALYGSVPGARPGEQTASGYGGGDVSAERLERRFIDRTLQAQKQQYLDAMHNLQRSYLNTTPPGPTSAPLAATRSGVGSGSGFGQSSSSQACSTSKSPWSPRSPDASKPLPALQDPSAWTEEGYSSAPLTGAALAAARGASRRTSTQRKPAKRRPSGRVLPYPGPSGGGGGGTDAHAQVGGNGGGHPGAQVMLCRTDSGPLKGLAQPDSPLAGGGKVRMMFNASFTSSRNLSFHGSDAGSGGSGASNTSSTWAASTTPAQGVTPPHLGPEVHPVQGGGASRRLLKAGAGAGVGAEGASLQTSPTRESRLSGRMTTAEAASAPAATAAGRGPTLHLQNSPPQKLLHVLMAKQRRASVSSVPGGASGSAPATTAAAAPALVPALSSPGALTAEVVPKPAPSLKSGQGMGGQARGEAESATPMGKSTAGAKKGIKVKVAQWADKLTHLFGRK